MARTARVSNPIRSPIFHLLVLVSAYYSAFTIGVPSNLYAFHHSIENSLCPYHTPARQFPLPIQDWALGFGEELKKPTTNTLSQIILDNAYILYITVTAGPKLANAYSQILSLLLLQENKLTTRRPSNSNRHCFVKLSSIAEYSPLLPPVGVWVASQSNVVDHPFRLTIDNCLYKLLHHQLANQTRALPLMNSSFFSSTYEVLAVVSNYCSPSKGMFLHVSHPSTTGNTSSCLTCMC